jgi:hypothetical protein
MARLTFVGSPGWLVGSWLVSVAACYSEPDVVSDGTQGTADGTADTGPSSSASLPTGDGSEAGPGSNTQGGTGDTTAGDPDTSTPDTDTTPGTGSTDDGGATDTGSTGEPAACSSGPLAVSWTEAPAFATQPNPQGLAGALIDGDEFLDIAVSSYDTSSVSIYLGDGTGGFALAGQVFSPGNASGVRLAAISDDTPDLFVSYYNAATFQNNLQRWRGDGSGDFQFGMGLGPAQVFTVGNFNGDDYRDVALGAGSPPVLSMRAGDVTESFGPPVEIGPYGGTPLAGDLDGDGDDDLVMAGGSNATVLINDNAVFSAQPSVNLLFPIGAATLGDPDDDGDLDLVTGTLGGGNTIAQVFPGDGAGGLGAPDAFPISNYTAYAAARDVDADGIDDLLLVANSGTLTFLHSNGDGTMEGEDVTAVDGCLNARGLVAEDINDDCIPDPILICSGGTEEVRIFLSDG